MYDKKQREVYRSLAGAQVDEIKGTVSSIRFSNEKNGYTVCDIRTEDNSRITLVGVMPLLVEGETISASGEFVSHVIYGRQFKVSSCQRYRPAKEDSILKYLSSGLIKGLGPATAKKIVNKFGEESFNVLQFEPLKLTEIKGISAEKALFFGEAFIERENMRSIIMFMNQFGISSNIAVKVWNLFGSQAEEEVRRNPYRLSEADIGLSFSVCDRIAFFLGFDPFSIERLKCALLSLLSISVGQGNTYTPKEGLIKRGVRLTKVDEELLLNAFDALLIEGSIYVERQFSDRVYTENLIEAERYIARKLTELNIKKDDYWVSECDSLIEDYQLEHKVELDSIQKEAVECALTQGVSIITGGPGTGKTTIIKALIEIFESKGLETILAAPTGRAAKRISETSGHEAKTIHRLLEVGYKIEEDSKPLFMRNEDNPLLADVLIIDEASMLDTIMTDALLRAFSWEGRLVLVGDADQLPSVGPGRILSDIIESEKFPVVKLETIFRQAEESQIIKNAHLINQGLMPELEHDVGDFFFIPKMNSMDVITCITELCASYIPDKYRLDPLKDIQVLTPMRKGDTGVDNLNIVLQKRLNPEERSKPQKNYGSVVFRLGDRVMQIRNDYNMTWTLTDEQGDLTRGLGVYNGDLGIIIDIDIKSELITVKFDDNRICEYGFDALDNLEHAFATTVHKSQGTEFPAVVISLFAVPEPLKYNNLLYTAITRAKELVVLVGSSTILDSMVRNINKNERYSGLKERL